MLYLMIKGETMAAVYEDDVIYLRSMTKDDTDLIIKWRNSDEVRSRFIYQALFTRQSHEKWIETMVNTGKVVQMIICLKDGDVPVGSVYIRDIDTTHHKGEYGIFIGEAEARGKGIGTRAAKLMTAYAFRESFPFTDCFYGCLPTTCVLSAAMKKRAS